MDKPYNSAVVVFKITDISLQDYGEDKSNFTIEGDILERPAFCSEFNNKIDKIVLHSFIDSRDRIEAVRSDYEIGRTYIANLQCSYIDYDFKAKNYISNRLGSNVSYADVDWSKLKVGAEKALEYDVYPLESVIGASIEFDGRIYGIEEQLSIDLGTCGGSFDFPGLKYEQDGVAQPSENPPLIAEIPGTLEEFLADPANNAWVNVIDNTNAQFNTSVVIGTDKINGLRLFYDKTMYLADGEDFSKDDYKSGSNVCIVSESAAYKNGWNIGDKITLSYYNGYVVPEIGCTERLPDVYNPEDDFGIMCQYEIKGIYRHTNIFSGDVDDITPNTVFVPNKNLDKIGLTDVKEAFLAECGDYFRDYAEEFNIKSMILKNGRVDDMKAFIEEHGWDLNWFKFYDGGYSQVQGIVEGVKGSAGNQLLASGITALTALIIYISLFVMRQRKNVGAMLSLGSGKSKAAGFMICVSTIPAVVATALGAIIGCALLRSSVNKVIMGATQQFDNTFSGAAAMGHGELDNVIVLPSAAIIAALVLLAVYIVSFTAAAFITVNKNPRNLMKK